MLKGKKTNMLGIFTIIFALTGLFLGKLDPTEAWQLITGGAAMLTIRDAIKNGK